MFYLYFYWFVVFLYMICDVSYFLRTCFAVLIGRLYQRKSSLHEVTTIYGFCTFQDCDIWFENIRLARLIRELDFARFHYYDRTGIYSRSQELRIHSLQGCTFTRCLETVPLFSLYKINTKLVYWDSKSLFFEHEVITLTDGKLRYLLVSRQHALSTTGDSAEALLEGIPGSEVRFECPEYIQEWLSSMEISSAKLRNKNVN